MLVFQEYELKLSGLVSAEQKTPLGKPCKKLYAENPEYDENPKADLSVATQPAVGKQRNQGKRQFSNSGMKAISGGPFLF